MRHQIQRMLSKKFWRDLVVAYDKFSDAWILDSGSSFYMCPHKEYLDSYKACDASTVQMGDDSVFKIV